jgi:hypothetical protein
MQICPNCGRQRPDSDTHCDVCGHILPLAVPELGTRTIKLDNEIYEALEPSRRWGTAYFGQQNRIELRSRDHPQSLVLPVEDRLVIGRFHDEPDVPQPDVDLSPFDAMDRGVSRTHLAVAREKDTISIADLGSSNGTFLNGQRLMPHEPRILRDGDELRLGRLVLRVAFV